MKDNRKPVFYMLFFSGILLLIILLMQPLLIFDFQEYIDVLFPKGSIAMQQRNLLFIIQALMLIIIIPVFILTFIFSWKYRANNPKAIYDPDLEDNILAEYVWWGVPLVMTIIIGVLTWYKTYELDPFKPIASEKKEVVVQVVALQWKWLFLYPEEGVATLNFVQIPEKTPIRFEITADAPMNSFWIPELGGQIYAMPKMKTELHLIADQSGEFRGSSANLSGEGFSAMNFVAKATSEEEFSKMIEEAKRSSKILDTEEYDRLVAPSQNNPVTFYLLKESTLFDQIMDKYMYPQEGYTQIS